MTIVGIDEVGRGCWAGPLVAGAVVLSQPIKGLRDSKKLSKTQRQHLAQVIHAEAAAIGLGWVQPSEIDDLGLTAAVRLAMRRALEQIQCGYDRVIIDGNLNFLSEMPLTEAVVRADDTVPAVSAASIVAKVARDAYMSRIIEEYPEYGFDKHVGYGTALHSEMLKVHGVSAIHRKSFKPVRALIQ